MEALKKMKIMCFRDFMDMPWKNFEKYQELFQKKSCKTK